MITTTTSLPDLRDDFLTTAQVSAVINIPVPTLRYWRFEGIGPKSFKMGPRKVFYKRADVDAWVAAQYASASGDRVSRLKAVSA